MILLLIDVIQVKARKTVMTSRTFCLLFCDGSTQNIPKSKLALHQKSQRWQVVVNNKLLCPSAEKLPVVFDFAKFYMSHFHFLLSDCWRSVCPAGWQMTKSEMKYGEKVPRTDIVVHTKLL